MAVSDEKGNTRTEVIPVLLLLPGTSGLFQVCPLKNPPSLLLPSCCFQLQLLTEHACLGVTGKQAPSRLSLSGASQEEWRLLIKL